MKTEPKSRSLLAALERIEAPLRTLEAAIGMAALVVMLASVFLSILFRTLAAPLPNLGEWALVAMAPVTFFGGALCSALNKHITIDLVESLPFPRMLRIVSFVAHLAILVFCLFFLVSSWSYLSYAFSSGERLTDLNTPIWLPLACVSAGTALMLFHTAIGLIRCIVEQPTEDCHA